MGKNLIFTVFSGKIVFKTLKKKFDKVCGPFDLEDFTYGQKFGIPIPHVPEKLIEQKARFKNIFNETSLSSE